MARLLSSKGPWGRAASTSATQLGSGWGGAVEKEAEVAGVPADSSLLGAAPAKLLKGSLRLAPGDSEEGPGSPAAPASRPPGSAPPPGSTLLLPGPTTLPGSLHRLLPTVPPLPVCSPSLAGCLPAAAVAAGLAAALAVGMLPPALPPPQAPPSRLLTSETWPSGVGGELLLPLLLLVLRYSAAGRGGVADARLCAACCKSMPGPGPGIAAAPLSPAAPAAATA